MSFLLVEREDRVLKITLNRADKRNALSAEMCEELVLALEHVQDDPAIGSILIEATGRVFCAGMDMTEAAAPGARDTSSIHERLFSIGRRSRKPIVACVNGPAMGGGVGLVAQAHVAIAAQGALFGLTEIRSGMWPFLVYRAMEAAIGPRRTLELSLTGRLFSTQEALTWGLIHQVAHAFEIEDRVSAVARDLAKSSPDTIRLGLTYVQGSRSLAWEQAGELAAELRRTCASSADFREGVAAFLEHREPRWPSMPAGYYSSAAPQPVSHLPQPPPTE